MIDGPVLVAEAMDAPVRIITCYAEPDAPESVVSAARERGIDVQAVAPGALAKVTSPVTPQSLAALAEIPPAAVLTELTGLVLVLVGVADPGNAGTLFRVAEAAGATAVVSCADAVDVWNPKCVRASAGSILRVPHVDGGGLEACCAGLGEASMSLVACDLAGSCAPDETDLRGNVALLLGNEAHGLAAHAIAAADRVVTIPMAGRVESLNVAMTGTVLAFEAARQRRLDR